MNLIGFHELEPHSEPKQVVHSSSGCLTDHLQLFADQIDNFSPELPHSSFFGPSDVEPSGLLVKKSNAETSRSQPFLSNFPKCPAVVVGGVDSDESSACEGRMCLWRFTMRLTFRSVVVWQLRTLNIGAALFLVKVEEEELELAEPLTGTHRKRLLLYLPLH